MQESTAECHEACGGSSEDMEEPVRVRSTVPPKRPHHYQPFVEMTPQKPPLHHYQQWDKTDIFVHYVFRISQWIILVGALAMLFGLGFYVLSAAMSTMVYYYESYQRAVKQRDGAVDYTHLYHCMDPRLRSKYIYLGFKDCLFADEESRTVPMMRAWSETWYYTRFYMLQKKAERLLNVLFDYSELWIVAALFVFVSFVFKAGNTLVKERAHSYTLALAQQFAATLRVGAPGYNYGNLDDDESDDDDASFDLDDDSDSEESEAYAMEDDDDKKPAPAASTTTSVLPTRRVTRYSAADAAASAPGSHKPVTKKQTDEIWNYRISEIFPYNYDPNSDKLIEQRKEVQVRDLGGNKKYYFVEKLDEHGELKKVILGGATADVADNDDKDSDEEEAEEDDADEINSNADSAASASVQGDTEDADGRLVLDNAEYFDGDDYGHEGPNALRDLDEDVREGVIVDDVEDRENITVITAAQIQGFVNQDPQVLDLLKKLGGFIYFGLRDIIADSYQSRITNLRNKSVSKENREKDREDIAAGINAIFEGVYRRALNRIVILVYYEESRKYLAYEAQEYAMAAEQAEAEAADHPSDRAIKMAAEKVIEEARKAARNAVDEKQLVLKTVEYKMSHLLKPRKAGEAYQKIPTTLAELIDEYDKYRRSAPEYSQSYGIMRYLFNLKKDSELTIEGYLHMNFTFGELKYVLKKVADLVFSNQEKVNFEALKLEYLNYVEQLVVNNIPTPEQVKYIHDDNVQMKQLIDRETRIRKYQEKAKKKYRDDELAKARKRKSKPIMKLTVAERHERDAAFERNRRRADKLMLHYVTDKEGGINITSSDSPICRRLKKYRLEILLPTIAYHIQCALLTDEELEEYLAAFNGEDSEDNRKIVNHYRDAVMKPRIDKVNWVTESLARRTVELLEEYAKKAIPDWNVDNSEVYDRRDKIFRRIGATAKRDLTMPFYFSEDNTKDKRHAKSGEVEMFYDKFVGELAKYLEATLLDNFAYALFKCANRTKDIVGIEDNLNKAIDVIESEDIGSLLPDIDNGDPWYFFRYGQEILSPEDLEKRDRYIQEEKEKGIKYKDIPDDPVYDRWMERERQFYLEQGLLIDDNDEREDEEMGDQKEEEEAVKYYPRQLSAGETRKARDDAMLLTLMSSLTKKRPNPDAASSSSSSAAAAPSVSGDDFARPSALKRPRLGQQYQQYYYYKQQGSSASSSYPSSGLTYQALSSLRQTAVAASGGKKAAVKATDEVINRWLDEDDDQPSITLSRATPSPAASPAATPFYQRPVSSVFYGGSGGSTVSASPYAAPSPYRPASASASSFSAAGAGSSGYSYATPSYFFGGGGGYNSLMSPSPAAATSAAAATPSMYQISPEALARASAIVTQYAQVALSQYQYQYQQQYYQWQQRSQQMAPSPAPSSSSSYSAAGSIVNDYLEDHRNRHQYQHQYPPQASSSTGPRRPYDFNRLYKVNH